MKRNARCAPLALQLCGLRQARKTSCFIAVGHHFHLAGRARSALIRADAGCRTWSYRLDPVALVSSDMISDESNELLAACSSSNRRHRQRRHETCSRGGALSSIAPPPPPPSPDLVPGFWRVEQEEMHAQCRNDFRLTEAGGEEPVRAALVQSERRGGGGPRKSNRIEMKDEDVDKHSVDGYGITDLPFGGFHFFPPLALLCARRL